jgi:hypothetical protein
MFFFAKRGGKKPEKSGTLRGRGWLAGFPFYAGFSASVAVDSV